MRTICKTFPRLTPGRVEFDLDLRGDLDTTFDLDLFRSPACDPSGYGEGFAFLIEGTLSTDSVGYGSITLDLHNRVAFGTALAAVLKVGPYPHFFVNVQNPVY